MPTLEELLRASLKGANENFAEANNALHAAVVEVAKAVEAATGGKATVRLQKMDGGESGTRYWLKVSAKDSIESRDLARFFVPNRGFPIYRESRDGEMEDTFSSAAGLATYFSTLVSDSDSPLVGYLAYIVRNWSNDPIPF